MPEIDEGCPPQPRDAQDIERAFADDAEGNVRHLVGPTLAVEVPASRVSFTAGPAFGLSDTTLTLLARAPLAASF